PRPGAAPIPGLLSAHRRHELPLLLPPRPPGPRAGADRRVGGRPAGVPAPFGLLPRRALARPDRPRAGPTPARRPRAALSAVPRLRGPPRGSRQAGGLAAADGTRPRVAALARLRRADRAGPARGRRPLGAGRRPGGGHL